MQFFFANKIEGSTIYFDAAETVHLQKSLRKRAGDEVTVLDGEGNIYQCGLLKDGRQIVADIRRQKHLPRDPARLHVAMAPTKNMSRFEWFVEKATELGISEITPLVTNRTERNKINKDRLRRIAISALKQSGSAWLPVLHELTPLAEFLKRDMVFDQKWIAHCLEGERRLLSRVLQPQLSTLLLIGPEGDFDLDEVKLVLENHFGEISLGRQRLRTETAGIFVTCLFNMVNQNR